MGKRKRWWEEEPDLSMCGGTCLRCGKHGKRFDFVEIGDWIFCKKCAETVLSSLEEKEPKVVKVAKVLRVHKKHVVVDADLRAAGLARYYELRKAGIKFVRDPNARGCLLPLGNVSVEDRRLLVLSGRVRGGGVGGS